MLKWIEDVLSDAKAVLLAPLTNVLCIAGLLLLVGAFVRYDRASGLAIDGQVHWIMLGSGFALAVISAVLFYVTRTVDTTRKRLDLENGSTIRCGGISIELKVGEIQGLQDTSRNSAVVLPCNTTFVDDCATDRRSALGAFFTARFPDRLADLPTDFRKALDARGISPDKDGQFPPGTTIILSEEFAKPLKVVLTASTIRAPGCGIVSSPQVICRCVEEIFKVSSNQRIDTLHIPILGSGHGGVDRGLALLFLILALLHFARTHHHIHAVCVIVPPKDVDVLNQSQELRQIIAL